MEKLIDAVGPGRATRLAVATGGAARAALPREFARLKAKGYTVEQL